MSDPLTLTRPIFIIGPGRSGTTLLRSVLSAHSQIAVTPETQFLKRALQWGSVEGAPNDFEAFWSNYTSWLRFRDLGVDPKQCRYLIERAEDYSFRGIFCAVLSVFQKQSGKARVGEKTPGHSAFIPTLLNWFPDARFLVTQRDPRAVVASQLKTYYVKQRLKPRTLRGGILMAKREQEIVFFARIWTEIFEQRLAPWAGHQSFHTVVYENLVQDTETEVRRIFNFLNEDFEPTVLEDRGRDTALMPANEADMDNWRREHHSRSMQPVSDDSLEKWRGELSRSEIAIIEGCCARSMCQRGYEPTLSRPYHLGGHAMASGLATSANLERITRSTVSAGRRRIGAAGGEVRGLLGKAASAGVERGAPPGWFGYRRVLHETVPDYFARHAYTSKAGVYETLYPEQVKYNALPRNITGRDQLPDDQGWWGYSFRDVPERNAQECYIATLPNCRITWYKDPNDANDFYPAILNGDGRALWMRELRFRPCHAETLRQSRAPVKVKAATWIAERCYHNHSHWLTAHLPKLLMLRERGMLGQVLLPPERSAALDDSLRMLGMAPENFLTFDMEHPLLVEELTVLGTDRFRPELLQMVPQALGINMAPKPFRKVFISRLNATRRRLVNEDAVWSLLEPQGFERVLMEDLSFAQQVELMRETSVLMAPHGAGLTNMMFCPRGAHIVEIADLGFPNPNFYAVASAMGHEYWLVSAESLGEGRPLDKDLRVTTDSISRVLSQLASGPVSGAARSSLNAQV